MECNKTRKSLNGLTTTVEIKRNILPTHHFGSGCNRDNIDKEEPKRPNQNQHDYYEKNIINPQMINVSDDINQGTESSKVGNENSFDMPSDMCNTTKINTYDLSGDDHNDSVNKCGTSNEINLNTRDTNDYCSNDANISSFEIPTDFLNYSLRRKHVEDDSNKVTISQTCELAENDKRDCAYDSSKDECGSSIDWDGDEIDFDKHELSQGRKFNKTKPSCDTALFREFRQKAFSMEKHVDVIKAYDRKHSIAELSRMFGYSSKQISSIVQNRDAILTAYAQTDSDCNNIEEERNNNKLNLKRCVKVIKMYKRYKIWRAEMPQLFGCSPAQSMYIWNNRKAILKKYEARCFNLYTRWQVEVLRFYSRENLSCIELSQLFNCSENHIKYILQNRDVILKNYKKSIGLTLNDRLDIINDVDDCKDRNEIRDLFKCSKKRIEKRDALKQLYNLPTKDKHTLDQRVEAVDDYDHQNNTIESVSSQCETSIKEYEEFLNDWLTIDSYKKAFIVLKPLEDYAKLRNNVTAINLVIQLKEYLQAVIARQSSIVEYVVEPSTLVSKSQTFSSYENILIALKPVEDYVNLKNNNNNAKNLLSQLEEHLKKKLNKVENI